jgi:hypothetical protein
LFHKKKRIYRATVSQRLRTTGVDSRLKDGGGVISLTSRPSFTARKIPGTHFCQRLSQHQGYTAAGRVRLIEKKINSSNPTRQTHEALNLVTAEEYY